MAEVGDMRGVRRFTPEEEGEIAAQYAGGANCWTLAQQRKCSEKTIYNVVRRSGVEVRPKLGMPQFHRRRFSPEDEARIVADYVAGVNPETLAATWGCGMVAIRAAVRRAGVSWKRRVTTKGTRNPRWSGGRMIDRDHYVLVLVEADDPLACMRNHRGYVFEHRLVMARHLGRPLAEFETVHHVNGDRADNRIENLQLRSGKHGPYQAIGCLECGSHRIGPVAIAEGECA